VLNQATARPGDASLASNPVEIARWCVEPILATVDYGAKVFEEELDWLELSQSHG